MVSFARARTRSWLARLWPLKAQLNNKAVAIDKSKVLIEKQQEQNKFFFETCKNGGIWFS